MAIIDQHLTPDGMAIKGLIGRSDLVLLEKREKGVCMEVCVCVCGGGGEQKDSEPGRHVVKYQLPVTRGEL